MTKRRHRILPAAFMVAWFQTDGPRAQGVGA